MPVPDFIRRTLLLPNVAGNLVRFCAGVVPRLKGDGRVQIRAKLHLVLIALSRLVLRHHLRGGWMRADGEFYVEMPDGLLLYYNIADPAATRGDGQSLEFVRSYAESPLERFVLQSVDAGATYIDVGANCGYFYTLKVARRCPACRILAFEPDPKIQTHLRKNLAINRIDNVTLVPCALSDEAGQRAMTSALGASNHLVSQHPAAPSDAVIDVACDTLDNVVERLALSNIAMIKVDIEGGEHGFLKGARSCIQRDRPILLLELDPSLLAAAGSSLAAVIGLLKDWDYRCFPVKGSRDVLALAPSTLHILPADRADWLSEMPDG